MKKHKNKLYSRVLTVTLILSLLFFSVLVPNEKAYAASSFAVDTGSSIELTVTSSSTNASVACTDSSIATCKITGTSYIFTSAGLQVKYTISVMGISPGSTVLYVYNSYGNIIATTTIDVNLAQQNWTSCPGVSTFVEFSTSEEAQFTCSVSQTDASVGVSVYSTSQSTVNGVSTYTYKLKVTPYTVGNYMINIFRSGYSQVMAINADITDHNWDAGRNQKVPTCLEEGKIHYTCIDCNTIREETVPSLGHKWNTEYMVDQEPTCITPGAMSHHCANSGCYEKTDVTVIPVVDHKWDKGTVTKEATCTEDGIRTFSCISCEETRTEAIASTGHLYDDNWSIDKEPTCREEGEKSHHCVNAQCEERIDVTAIPIVDHEWDEGVITKEATCTEDGVKTFTCIHGKETRTETVKATGHIYTEKVVSPTTTSKGYTEHRCKSCNHSYRTGYKNQLPVVVKFDSNGGNKPSKQSISLVYGSKYNTLPTVTRKGYSFSGWYTAKSGGTKVNAATIAKKNTTVYAHWVKVTVSKPAIQKLTTSSKKLNVSIKKVSGVKGYEIRYSKKSNMKSASSINTSKTSITIAKLKSKTTYYVQVRAYKVDSTGKKVYGNWSNSKSLKIK